MPVSTKLKNSFAKTKAIFKSSISKILDENGNNDVLSESAFPAYANKNPFIDRLFWKRISEVYYYIAINGKENNTALKVLDFGCGSAVLSYALAIEKHYINAFDITLKPVQQLKRYIDYPENITFTEGNLPELAKFQNESFDFIAALDVFEHISDLDPYIEIFRKILKKNGEIIVTGPTENFIYKLGRKIAGREYSGKYHETSIVQVRRKFEMLSEVRLIGTLYPVLPLFEIFTVRF